MDEMLTGKATRFDAGCRPDVPRHAYPIDLLDLCKYSYNHPSNRDDVQKHDFRSGQEADIRLKQGRDLMTRAGDEARASELDGKSERSVRGMDWKVGVGTFVPPIDLV